ncbi:MAG TPA: dUTP diphosphatase, partial [Bacilli bacterium]|nr:dUTP diphosphatase [Bacilli bacterium]
MSQMIELKELYRLQGELDARIASNHKTSYEKTTDDRLMALIVEIGELANETRCFKYWSNKGPSPREVLLDEYADG